MWESNNEKREELNHSTRKGTLPSIFVIQLHKQWLFYKNNNNIKDNQ